MRRLLFFFTIFLAFATSVSAQIGKSVAVAAGTPEDQALSAIYAAPDGPGKVALIDQFMSDYGKGDLELLGDQLYVQTYVAQKNYAKVYEYGEKALALDPDNLSTAVNMVHAAEEQGDTQKLFTLGEKISAILARYKTAAAPAGIPPAQWPSEREANLKNAQADINYVEYAMVNAAYKVGDPAARAALFERFAAAFPDSGYTTNVREQTAVAYQQAQNIPKMLDTAQGILKTDENNISMLLLLADYWSDNDQQLDKAAEYAHKALGFLVQATKPDNVAADQWQQQVSLQKGLAYSALGQVDVINGHNEPAVESFKQASPLLKSNTFSYARNLYRWGFTLAKMKRTAEARTVLTEAVSINSPYKARAQETLDMIGGPVSSHPRHKRP